MCNGRRVKGGQLKGPPGEHLACESGHQQKPALEYRNGESTGKSHLASNGQGRGIPPSQSCTLAVTYGTKPP